MSSILTYFPTSAIRYLEAQKMAGTLAGIVLAVGIGVIALIIVLRVVFIFAGAFFFIRQLWKND